MVASILVGAVRRYAPINASSLTLSARQIHISQITRRANDNGDLVGDGPASQTTFHKSTKLPYKHSNVRERQFQELLQFVRDRTGRVKVVKAGQVSTRSWLRLFQLASNAEHLKTVAEVFPQWRESGKSFTSLDAEMFVRRCEELDCPLLALSVFGDHPKYGLALSSFPAARTLIHSLYQKHSLESTIAAISLLGMSNLSPVTSDPASCAMLYAACLRSKSKHASLLGRDIRIALQQLLRDTKPYTEPKEKFMRARHSVKPDVWLLEALRDIKKTKREQGRGTSWVTEWIARGEGRMLPPLSERRRQAWSGKHLQEASIPVASEPPQQTHAS